MKHKQFIQSRITWLGLVLTGLFGVIIIRLFFMQIVQYGYYTDKAKESQEKEITLPARRGEIYLQDGSGAPTKVALNEAIYTVYADPSIIEDNDRGVIIQALKEIAGAEMAKNAPERIAKKESKYQVLATGISRTQAEKIKSRNFVGVGFVPSQRRVYPEGELGAQLLGFVNMEGKAQYGVEQGLNDQLAGKDGVLRTVTDVRQVPLSIGKDNMRREPVNGKNIVLTVDRNIQAYAEEALEKGLRNAGATNGSVLVMDPKTSEVKAMANYPTYDPNRYYAVKDGSAFSDYAVSTPYEPASVIKSFIFAAAIDQGKITPQTTYHNAGSVQVADALIKNAYQGGIGTRTIQEAFNWSLNTGSVFAARQLGGGQLNRQARDIMYDYYHQRFHFGELTGIEVAGESKGRVVSPSEEQGNAVRYSNMTFGQGMNVTMIQVATAYNALINGGKYRAPTIVAGEMNDTEDFTPSGRERPTEQVISEHTSEVARQMAVTGRQNLPEGLKKDKKGYTIGGKTGTSQVVEGNHYVFSETVGTYLGFGGAETPEYVIMVRVAAPGKKMEGGLHASPIFTDISNWLLDYKKIYPKKD